MLQVARASEEIGIFARVLDAKDENARAWYLRLGLGFQPLTDDPNHLFIAVATIRKALH